MRTTLGPVRSRYEPLWRDFDRLFDELMPSHAPARSRQPVVQLHDTDDAFVLTAEVPGLTGADLEIEATERYVRVEGKRELTVPEGARSLHRERQSFSFARAFDLPGPVVVDEVDARLEHGILTVRLPKRAEVQPRKITVKPTGGE